MEGRKRSGYARLAQTPIQPFYVAQWADDVIKMEAGSGAGYVRLPQATSSTT